MDLKKHNEFFNPIELTRPIHIIGLGATGSHIAEQLARLGCTDLHLWDFDVVSSHNIPNQMFYYYDIGELKTGAVGSMLLGINPEIKLTFYDRYTNEKLEGYVFMCADTLECRKNIIKFNRDNVKVDAVFDFRLRLEDAQHYAADWNSLKEIETLEASMNFTQEEADKATPVSGCGTTLAIIPTIKCITSLGIANFINMVKGCDHKKMIIFNPFAAEIVAI
jgi:hypothetical protein